MLVGGGSLEAGRVGDVCLVYSHFPHSNSCQLTLPAGLLCFEYFFNYHHCIVQSESIKAREAHDAHEVRPSRPCNAVSHAERYVGIDSSTQSQPCRRGTSAWQQKTQCWQVDYARLGRMRRNCEQQSSVGGLTPIVSIIADEGFAIGHYAEALKPNAALMQTA